MSCTRGCRKRDLGFDKYEKSCEVICKGTELHFCDQIRVLSVWEEPQRLHGKRASTRCQTQATVTVDGVRDGNRLPGAEI